MSTALLWFLGTVTLIGLAVTLGIVWLRITSPHSREMAAEQARLNQRTGIATPATTAPAPKTKSTPMSARLEWLGNKFWTIFFIAIGLAVSYFGLYHSSWEAPRFATVGAWGWNHWLWILILWGVCAALIELNANAFGKAKPLVQKVLTGAALFILFLGSPLGQWMVSDNGARKIADKSPVQVLTMPANGTSAHISAPSGRAVAFTGNGFTVHCVYTDGSEGIVGNPERPCHNGPMTYQYVLDTTGFANSVTYEFVLPN